MAIKFHIPEMVSVNKISIYLYDTNHFGTTFFPPEREKRTETDSVPK